MCGSDVFLGIVAIFFPPIAVWVKRGICSADSLINICLMILGYVPGLLHAWYIIASTPSPTYEQLSQQDPERGQVRHYYIQAQPRYGTVNSTPNSQFPAPKNGGFVQPHSAPAPSVAPAGSSSAAAQDASTGEQAPPSYQQAVQGDNKVQAP